MPGANRNPEQPRKLAKIEQSDNTQKIKIDTIEEVVDNGIDLEELGISQDLVDRYFDLVNEEVPEDEEHAKNYAIRVGYFIEEMVKSKFASCLHCDKSQIILKPHYDKYGDNGSQVIVISTTGTGIEEEEERFSQDFFGVPGFKKNTFPASIGRCILEADQQFVIGGKEHKENPKRNN